MKTRTPIATVDEGREATHQETSAPARIQRKRVKGWRMPEGAIYVGRPTRWGNPFYVGCPPYKHSHIPIYDEITLDNLLEVFETYAKDRVDEDEGWLEPLRGKDIACWCPLNSKCHADILLELANA